MAGPLRSATVATTTKTKSLTRLQNDRGRTALQELINRRWDGCRKAAADAIGVSKTTISDYLNYQVGGGAKIAAGLVDIDIDVAFAVLGGRRDVLRDVPGFEAAYGEARSRWGHRYSAELWDELPSLPSILRDGATIDAAGILALVQFLDLHQ